MGKLRKLFTWFRDSQSPRRVRAAPVRKRSAVDDELRAPHYYAFYYPKGREPGSGWKYPKMYVGPCTTRECAEDEIAQSWPARAGEPRARFKLKRLTADQFTEIWGAAPGAAPCRWDDGD